MRKSRKVLRLRFELDLGCQQVARSCAIAASTAHKHLKRAEAPGLSWPLPEGWDDSRIGTTLSRAAEPPPSGDRRIARRRISPPSMSSCALISPSHCNCCGKNTVRRIRTAIATRASANL